MSGRSNIKKPPATTVANDAATRQRYKRFLSANYSSNTFLFVIVGYFVFNECVFPDYAVLSASVESAAIQFMTYLSMALRFVVFCLVAIIWFCKTCDDTAPFPWIPTWLVDALPTMQGMFPMLMNITFSIYIICDRFVCTELDRPQLHKLIRWSLLCFCETRTTWPFKDPSFSE